jgi:hypothetical protein
LLDWDKISTDEEELLLPELDEEGEVRRNLSSFRLEDIIDIGYAHERI